MVVSVQNNDQKFLGDYFVDGCAKMVRDFERNSQLVQVQVRLEEKIEEYFQPQRDLTVDDNNPYKADFERWVAEIVTKVSSYKFTTVY